MAKVVEGSGRRRGGSKPGERRGGRQKGTPNQATRDVRAAIAIIAERNVDKFEGWLDRVAEDDPGKAASLFLQAIEYHIPKLARSEHTGKDGEDLPKGIGVVFL